MAKEVEGRRPWEFHADFPRIEKVLDEVCGGFVPQDMGRIGRALSEVHEQRGAQVRLEELSAIGAVALLSDVRRERRHFVRPGRIQLERTIKCRLIIPSTLLGQSFIEERSGDLSAAFPGNHVPIDLHADLGSIEYVLGSSAFCRPEEAQIAHDYGLLLNHCSASVSEFAAVMETVATQRKLSAIAN